MAKSLSVLFAGETWSIHTTEVKGFDQFTVSSYGEGIEYIQKAVRSNGHQFTHIASHRIPFDFPDTLSELRKYDVVLVSDVGANTFLLHPDTFFHSIPTANKLQLIHDFVREGGGFGMIGGYLTFQGIEAKGKYKDTVIEKILPVKLLNGDDRVEMPEGSRITIDPDAHPILNGFPEVWPPIFGYNRLKAKPDASVLVEFEGDPIITLGSYGKGRTLAYATDCAPHWSPKEFCEWDYYRVLWGRLLEWLAGSG